MAMTPKQLQERAAKRKSQPAPLPKEVKAEPTPTTAAKPGPADPADIVDYCNANSQPQMAANLIRDRATLEEVKAKVGAIKQIKRLTALARSTGCPIDNDFERSAIARGLSVEQVRTMIFSELVTKQSPEIRGNTSAGGLTRAAEMEDMGWGRAVRAVNAKHQAK